VSQPLTNIKQAIESATRPIEEYRSPHNFIDCAYEGIGESSGEGKADQKTDSGGNKKECGEAVDGKD
jgi:hypothetical protein